LNEKSTNKQLAEGSEPATRRDVELSRHVIEIQSLNEDSYVLSPSMNGDGEKSVKGNTDVIPELLFSGNETYKD
jgi:hypothetical protein